MHLKLPLLTIWEWELLSCLTLILEKQRLLKDSMRVFSEMYSAIGYRGAKHSTLLEMAKDSTIPIINGYTDHQHPTQMLADAMTLDEVWDAKITKGKPYVLLEEAVL